MGLNKLEKATNINNHISLCQHHFDHLKHLESHSDRDAQVDRKWNALRMRVEIDLDIQEIAGHWQCKERI